MRLLRVCSVVVACLAVSSCTTSQVKPAVEQFAAATGDAKKALDAQTAALNDALIASANSWALASPGRPVTALAGDCTDGDPRCRLVVFTPHGDQAPFTPGGGYVSALMQGFADYAAGLRDIVDAGDPVALNKATDGVKQSILAFAGTAANAAKLAGLDATALTANAAAVADPLEQIATLALQHYTDARKLAAIKAAVLGMDPILAEATPVFERTAELGRRVQVSAAEKRFTTLYAAYLHGPVTAKLLNDLRAAAVSYDTALQSHPDDVFATLGEAHAKLALALSGRAVSFNDLWPILNELSAEAAEVAAAAKKLQEAKSAG